MSEKNPVLIKGHKNKIYRIGTTSRYVTGLWKFQCECGESQVSKGQAIVAAAKRRHENAVVFDAPVSTP